jgi:hypothetical protein
MTDGMMNFRDLVEKALTAVIQEAYVQTEVVGIRVPDQKRFAPEPRRVTSR